VRAEGAGEAPRPGPAGDQAAQAGAQAQGEGPGRGCSDAHGSKKVQAFWGEEKDD